MTIRPETPADRGAIEAVHIAAFAHHPHSRQTEHRIVAALRAAHALTVSLVAEADGAVVGHIAFSPIRIDGRDCPWYILGPVGVLPEFQRWGIGGALVRQGLDSLRRLEAEGCVLVGDPAYYSRFGFAHDPALTLEGVPPEVFLCLPMAGGVPRGCVSYDAAFHATA
jgi:putative acetyltransferase